MGLNIAGVRKFGKVHVLCDTRDPRPAEFGDINFATMIWTRTLGHLRKDDIKDIGAWFLHLLNETGLTCKTCDSQYPYKEGELTKEDLKNDGFLKHDGCQSEAEHVDPELFDQTMRWWADHVRVGPSIWSSVWFKRWGRIWQAITPYHFADLVLHVKSENPLKALFFPKNLLLGYFKDLASYDPESKKDWLEKRVAQMESKLGRSLTASEKKIQTEDWKSTHSKRFSVLFLRPYHIRGAEGIEDFELDGMKTQLLDMSYHLQRVGGDLAVREVQKEEAKASRTILTGYEEVIRDSHQRLADVTDKKERWKGAALRSSQITPTVPESLSTAPTFGRTEIPPLPSEERAKPARDLPGWLNPMNAPLFFAFLAGLAGFLTGGDPVNTIYIAASIGFFAVWSLIRFFLAPRVEAKKEKAKQEQAMTVG